MSRAVLSIGSNLGDRAAALQSAVDAMRPWVRAVSPVYETAPWGPVAQDDYLNAIVVVADDASSARDWLILAQRAERDAGRVRDVRWGPRTLDVDIVDVDGTVSDDPELTLPHPRAVERAFVLVPWLDVDPAASISGRAVREVVSALGAEELAGLHRRDDLVVA